MSKGALGDAFLNLRSVIRLSTSITQGCEDFTTAMSISAEIPTWLTALKNCSIRSHLAFD